jgi:hypothetical protein
VSDSGNRANLPFLNYDSESNLIFFGVDASGSGIRLVPGLCEYGNEP